MRADCRQPGRLRQRQLARGRTHPSAGGRTGSHPSHCARASARDRPGAQPLGGGALEQPARLGARPLGTRLGRLAEKLRTRRHHAGATCGPVPSSAGFGRCRARRPKRLDAAHFAALPRRKPARRDARFAHRVLRTPVRGQPHAKRRFFGAALRAAGRLSPRYTLVHTPRNRDFARGQVRAQGPRHRLPGRSD